MNAHHLAGLILNTTQPEAIARFYREALGVPFELQRHGRIRDHFECDFAGVHFALLHHKSGAGKAFVPSFAVGDLGQALADLAVREVKPLHPIIELGAGKRVCSVLDPDGNVLRLFQQTEKAG